MKNLSKGVLVVAGIAVAAVALSGCSSDGGGLSKPSTVVPSASAAPDVAPAPAAPSEQSIADVLPEAPADTKEPVIVIKKADGTEKKVLQKDYERSFSEPMVNPDLPSKDVVLSTKVGEGFAVLVGLKPSESVTLTNVPSEISLMIPDMTQEQLQQAANAAFEAGESSAPLAVAKKAGTYKFSVTVVDNETRKELRVVQVTVKAS